METEHTNNANESESTSWWLAGDTEPENKDAIAEDEDRGGEADEEEEEEEAE